MVHVHEEGGRRVISFLLSPVNLIARALAFNYSENKNCLSNLEEDRVLEAICRWSFPRGSTLRAFFGLMILEAFLVSS